MNFKKIKLSHHHDNKQARADVVLIDVTEKARENGFKISTAVTEHLYQKYITPPTELEDEGQSIIERLQILFAMTKAAASLRWNNNKVYFDVLFLMKNRQLEKVRCLAIIDRDGEGNPCLTIKLPEEG